MKQRVILYYGVLPWCDVWRSRPCSRLVVDDIVFRRDRRDRLWDCFSGGIYAPSCTGYKTAADAARWFVRAQTNPPDLRFSRTHRWVYAPSRDRSTSESLVLVRARDLRAIVEPAIPDPEAP